MQQAPCISVKTLHSEMTFPTSLQCNHRPMITHIRVTLTRTIAETLGTEFMQSFYEQSIPHPSGDTLSIDDDSCSSSSTPTISSRARYHLKWNSPSHVPAPSSPVPAAQVQRTPFRSPGRYVEPTVVCTSPPPHQHINSTVSAKQRLALIHPVSLSALTAPTDLRIVRLVMASTVP